jgi:predicted PurR-regulated permease PerM
LRKRRAEGASSRRLQSSNDCALAAATDIDAIPAQPPSSVRAAGDAEELKPWQWPNWPAGQNMNIDRPPRIPTGSGALFSADAALRAVLVALAGTAILFLAWRATDALLLIFAGLLFAALLESCARGLSKVLPIGHGANLAIVTVGIAVLLAGLLVWSGFSLAQDINALLETLNRQLQSLEQSIAQLGVGGKGGNATPASPLVNFLFPNPQQLFGEARSAFTLTLGAIGYATIIVLIGIFVAANPGTYRTGIVEFLPLRQRHRVGTILDETALYLRRWLIGQLAAMALLTILTWIMLLVIGVPDPILLGVQAGLFDFIPYLGAILGAVPILLISLQLGTTPLLITLGLFSAIHIGVGYIVMPLIQKQAVHLAPALTLASLVLFSVLFGVASAAVATPLVAVIRLAILRMRQIEPGHGVEVAGPS